MRLTPAILRARLRARWRALVTLTVLAGVGLGASAAVIAIAGRTDSAYRRVADDRQAVHFEWSFDGSPESLHQQLREQPDPALGEVRQWVGFTDFFGAFSTAPDILAPWRSDVSLESPVVIEGSAPIAAAEMLVDERLADVEGVAVGDRFVLGMPTSDFSEVVPHELVVSGIGVFAAEQGMADDTGRTPTIVLSRTFAERHPEHVIWSGAGSVLDSPPSRAEVSAILRPHGFSAEGISLEKEASAKAALRPAVTSLYVLGGLALFSTAAIMAFSVSRELEVFSDQRQVLRALGADRRAIRRIDAANVVALGLTAVVIGVGTLLALSAVGPVGDLRRFEPNPGVFVDWRAIVAVVASAALGCLVALQLAGRTPAVAAPVEIGDDLAIRLLGGSASTSRRVLALSVGLGMLGMAAASAVIPYSMSLDALADDPARYGQPWEAMVRNRWGQQAPDAIDEVVSDPLVDAAATLANWTLIINNEIVAPGAVYEPLVGDDLLPITAGRLPRRDDEAVIGAQTMADLGLELGESVEIRAGVDPGFGVVETSGAKAQVRLVGQAVFPTLSLPGGAAPRLDVGLVASRAIWDDVVSPEQQPSVILASTRSVEDVHELAGRFPRIDDVSRVAPATEWFIGARPAEIRSSEQTQPFLVAGLAALTLLLSGLLTLALRAILRDQQRDLATLRALGATRRQVSRIAWKQGMLLLVPMLVVGVPVGIALGRLLFVRLAESIGVVADPHTPPLVIAAFIAIVLVISGVAMAAAAQSVNRIAPATSLREN